MKVLFRDFWESHPSDYFPNFHGDITKSFLSNLGSLIARDCEREIVYTSVYKKDNLTRRVVRRFRRDYHMKLGQQYGKFFSTSPKENSFNIWFTAENIRPPLQMGFDAYLSFDLDEFSGLNHYLPLWFCRLGPSVDSANQRQISLTERREVDMIRPNNFAVVASNPEQIRTYFVSRISQYEKISIYGKLGNELSNKDSVLKNFNFNVCFENDLYPGYVTEKAFEAYISGCVPIWRGIDAGGFFNKEAIIDVTDLNIESAIEKVMEISKDQERLHEMRKEPLLKKTIPIQELIRDLQTSYDQS